jgi:hypothetical protein
MANYVESWRSNTFAVTDPVAFKKFVAGVGDIEVCDCEDGSFKLFGEGESFPSSLLDSKVTDDPSTGLPAIVESEGSEEDFDLGQNLARFLRTDSVLILVGCGYEKTRYVTGWAQAYNSKGEHRRLSIDDIVDLAKAAFPGAEVTPPWAE